MVVEIKLFLQIGNKVQPSSKKQNISHPQRQNRNVTQNTSRVLTVFRDVWIKSASLETLTAVPHALYLL